MATPSRERLDELLEQTDAVFRDAFLQYVADVKSEKVMNAIADRLEDGDLEGALDIVRAHVVVMGQTIPRAIDIAANAAIAEALSEFGENVIAIAFDPTHPRAAAIIRQERLNLIREFTEKQIEATRAALSEGFLRGEGTAATARAFRDSIGLSTYHQGVIDNYRRMLTEGSAESLQRELRDRRFDRTVRRAITTRQPLRPEQIDRMVQSYRNRVLANRAETIARTESVRATSIAREESFRQIVDQTGTHNRAEQIWNATLDNRVRDFHASMNGQARALGQMFVDGLGNRLRYPGDQSAPPKTTINCRCVLTFRIRPA